MRVTKMRVSLCRRVAAALFTTVSRSSRRPRRRRRTRRRARRSRGRAGRPRTGPVPDVPPMRVYHLRRA